MIDDGAHCSRCDEWSNDGSCRCDPAEQPWRPKAWVPLVCGHRVYVDTTIPLSGYTCLACNARCAVENCRTPLGAPRDRGGACAPCADEIEAMERDERRKRVA